MEKMNGCDYFICSVHVTKTSRGLFERALRPICWHIAHISISNWLLLRVVICPTRLLSLLLAAEAFTAS